MFVWMFVLCSGVPENLSQEGSPEIVIQVDNESGSRGGRSNVQRSFLQNHVCMLFNNLIVVLVPSVSG